MGCDDVAVPNGGDEGLCATPKGKAAGGEGGKEDVEGDRRSITVSVMHGNGSRGIATVSICS